MLRMDELKKIRKKFFVKRESRGRITKSFRCSWNTVNQKETAAYVSSFLSLNSLQ